MRMRVRRPPTRHIYISCDVRPIDPLHAHMIAGKYGLHVRQLRGSESHATVSKVSGALIQRRGLRGTCNFRLTKCDGAHAHA